MQETGLPRFNEGYYPPEFDPYIICECGHENDWHEQDDDYGEECTHKGCECTEFRAKKDTNGNIVYGEIPQREIDAWKRSHGG